MGVPSAAVAKSKEPPRKRLFADVSSSGHSGVGLKAALARSAAVHSAVSKTSAPLALLGRTTTSRLCTGSKITVSANLKSAVCGTPAPPASGSA